MHGWLIIDKPVGIGSTQVVSAVKRALRTARMPKVKVGHGGTLDPLASGVLPIALGEATKLAGRMLDSDKVYAFTLAFGAETTTLDAEGNVTVTSDVRPSVAEVDAVLPRFTGAIAQVPPAYSALKVDGQRAYDRARAGEEVVLAERHVTIHALTRDGDGAGDTVAGETVLDQVTLVAHVSKGTYIRSLARDIAYALGTVGHVTWLHRVKAGPFALAQAITLDKLDAAAKACALEPLLLPLRAGLDDIPAFSLTPDQAGALRQGRVLDGIAADDGLVFACTGDTPVALAEVEAHQLRVVRGFNL
jgi:tRNA pseudouridine55 synthase